MQHAWSSPFIVKIVKDPEYNINEKEASYFAILPPFAMMLSCYCFAVMFDVIGRKHTLMIAAIPQILAWVLTIVTKNLYILYVSRILVGIAAGCIYATLPVYVGEIASPKMRGLAGGCITTFSFIGKFLIHIVGNYFSVPVTAYICIPLPILFFVSFFFMPESPYYYIMKKDFDSAKKSLKKLKGNYNVDQFLKLKNDVERQMTERAQWKDIIKIKSNRKATLLSFFLRTSQQLGGMAIYTSSMRYIFEKSKGFVSSDIASEIFTFCSCVFYFIASYSADKFGRRTTYIISTFFVGLIFSTETVYFYLDQYQPEIGINVYNWFPLIGLLVCIFVASFGPGVVPTIMISELFSTSIKAKTSVFNVFTMGIIVFIANNLFYFMNFKIGLYGPFAMFAILNLGSSVISYFYLPETKGKTLEEIQQMLKTDKLR